MHSVPGEPVNTLLQIGVTHVVWLPDATTGSWEKQLLTTPDLNLVRICREGEAWAIAAGLLLGGKTPLIILQNTGLFESGDALRNILFELCLPLYAIVGYRNFRDPLSQDTAKRFTEPIIKAWELDYVLLSGDDPWRRFAEHFSVCQKAGRPGVSLLLE